MDKRISIVIVTWNAKHFLKQCILSVYRETKNLPFELIVVDNASSDGSMEMVKKEFPEVELLRNDKNLGFSKANNRAIQKILKEQRSDYILLLNVDTLIRDRAINRLVSYLESNPDAGAVSPALMLPSRRFQTGAGGYLPGAITGFNYFFFLSRLLPQVAKPLFIEQSVYSKKKGPVSVEWLSGACLTVKREVVESIGLMDEDYYFYAEDIDWGRRMKRKGVRLHYLPWISIIHYQGMNDEKSLREINTKWLMMLYKYVKKEKGQIEYVIFRFFSIVGFLLRLFLYALIYLFKKEDFLNRKIKEIYYFFISALIGREFKSLNITQ